MSVTRAKMFSAAAGGCALPAAVLLNVTHPDQTSRNVADGRIGRFRHNYRVQPNIPAMSLNPTAMKVGGTATAAPPATTLATST